MGRSDFLQWLRTHGVEFPANRIWWFTGSDRGRVTVHTSRSCPLAAGATPGTLDDLSGSWCDPCFPQVLGPQEGLYEYAWKLHGALDVSAELLDSTHGFRGGWVNRAVCSEKALLHLSDIGRQLARFERFPVLEPLRRHVDAALDEVRAKLVIDPAATAAGILELAAVMVADRLVPRPLAALPNEPHPVALAARSAWTVSILEGAGLQAASMKALHVAAGDIDAMEHVDQLSAAFDAALRLDRPVPFVAWGFSPALYGAVQSPVEVVLNRAVRASDRARAVGVVPEVVFDWLSSSQMRGRGVNITRVDGDFGDLPGDVFDTALVLMLESHGSALGDPASAFAAAAAL